MPSAPFSALSDKQRDELEEAGHPDWVAPMLATLTDERFSDPDWIFERKLDGERALAFRDGRKVRLLTRNQKDISETYPEITEALSEQECSDFVVDGEIVAFKGRLTSFSRLQQRMQITDADKARGASPKVWFYMFDLVHCNRHRLDALPLRSRKQMLRRAINFDGRLRYTPHRNANGEAYFKEACDKGWEGLIAKKAESAYRHSRSRDWLKFKCGKGQELVIGGYTAPRGERLGFGALLVGYYDDDKLRYAGKVGTGYDDEFLREFRKQLDRIKRESSPFEGEAPEGDDITFVQPRHVGEFGFTEWTTDGKLRHPRFLGLRRDKSPRDVVREEPE